MRIQIVNEDQCRLLRMRSQRLIPQSEGLTGFARTVLADVFCVQAQDDPSARLSLRARSTGLTAEQVARERREPQGIVRTWCLRGTLHLLLAEDARWLVPLLGPRLFAAGEKRFKELGWDGGRAEVGFHLLGKMLEVEGSLTRLEVVALLRKDHLPAEGQAPVHLLYQAALRGMLCMGPDREGEPVYVPFERWVGEPQPLGREEGLRRLALRYLQAYGPAGPDDFARWAGLPLGEASQTWKLIGGEIFAVEMYGKQWWLPANRQPWLDEVSGSSPVLRLLPAYDTYLLGYAGRDLAVPSAYARRVHPGGGVIHPVVLVDGLVCGMWKTRRKKNRLLVLVEPFETLPRGSLPQIEKETDDLGRFLGEAVELQLVSEG